MLQTLTCRSCEAKSFSSQPSRLIVLQLEGNNLQDSLCQEMESAIISQCECGCECKILRKDFLQPPDALLLSINIFNEHGERIAMKSNWVPMQLNLSRFCDNKLLYDFASSVQHIGSNVNAHYYATGKANFKII